LTEFRAFLHTQLGMAPDKNELRFSLEDKAFPLWALRKYQKVTNKSERSALEYIIERWAMLEPSAKAYGITLKDFEHDAKLADVVSITSRKQPEDGGTTG
jgi:hypothetical protein